MRQQLIRRWQMSRLSQRLADASQHTDDERREAGRETVAKLVRRLPRPGEST